MNKIAVLGSGLLGGSIALAAQSRMQGVAAVLWGRREDSIREAKELGITYATTDLENAVSEADMIILATPVGAMLQILDSVSKIKSLKDIVITDVGSVKLTPRDTLEAVVQAAGGCYIGSHPMAGSEQAGIHAARANLFMGAACVMTNDFNHSEEKVTLLRDFWEALGCECYQTSSEEHDRVMARISHLPHLLASVGALVGLKYSEDRKFAGNGLRDTTRVASGHPAMWAEILLRNRGAIKEPIEEAIGHLRDVLAFLEDSSEEQLERLLNDAKQHRDNL
ncbi:MAG: prephenate dehydrogenase/arogenate dehydrogenase family protein [Akkermansiaceae bacterium]|jgi:prephenate dehydrogenase|nr:prephenate dehydrogenase/arogenate dehydrogenase family protein [Akkermansiaceae bacterium]